MKIPDNAPILLRAAPGLPPPPDRSATLRRRLLLAMSLVALPACKGGEEQDSGDISPYSCPTQYSEGCMQTPEGGCSAGLASAYLAWSSMYSGCWLNSPTPLRETEELCCYEVACDFCCGYGRPFIAQAAVVEPEVVPTDAWSSGPAPALDDLSAAERATLAEHWLASARAEHSSIAGFHRFALDLIAHGAPVELLAEAQRAAAQELEHARACFGLASAYAGRALGAGTAPLGSSARVAASLEELALWTAVEGAIGETIAAYVAGEALARSRDPAVRAALERIVADETEHAALAWATLRWAVDLGGDPLRRKLDPVFRSLALPLIPDGEDEPRLQAHGLPGPRATALAGARCIREVVLPCAASLLSRAALSAA